MTSKACGCCAIAAPPEWISPPVNTATPRGTSARCSSRQAVDCLQADVTRCGGFTGFFKVAALCEAFHIPLSAHCAPHLHTHIACCLHPLRHVEYFHDHVRIADMLFDGHEPPIRGHLSPDPSRPGHGLALKTPDAEKFAV